MPIRDLVPSFFTNRDVPVRRGAKNPVEELYREMNQLFDDFFGHSVSRGLEKEPCFEPCIDLHENDKDYIVEAEIPGIDKENVDIAINGDVMTIKGEKKNEAEEKKDNYYRLERSFGQFSRDIPIPEDVDRDKIDAKFKNGVLKIELPKNPKAQRSAKRIEITSE